MEDYDFSGWATRNNIQCSDGRTILKDAFKDCDGQTVPLVWNHNHSDPFEVLGHAELKNMDDGVYAYGKLNDTESGQTAKLLIQHGDIDKLSIYANKLKQHGGNVLHGAIREVSLVLAGANPGAYIDEVISHSDSEEFEATIGTGEYISLAHADVAEPSEDEETLGDIFNTLSEKQKNVVYAIIENALEHSDNEEEQSMEDEKTVGDVFETLSEEQKTAVYAIIGAAIDGNDGEAEHSDLEEGGENYMKHNVFDEEDFVEDGAMSHSDFSQILEEAKASGGRSLRNTFLSHFDTDEEALAHTVTNSAGNDVTYGIADIEYMFPDAKYISNTPDFIKRDTDWVSKVIAGSKHLPFSRVKTLHADITMDEARAKGYVKGNQKTNEVFALLKRSTTPCTIYKKQKLDRDDVVDIVDVDVVSFMRGEMRLMLDEELARAALIGDGREAGTDDKIPEDNIRPIWTDNSLYTIRKAVTVSAGADDQDKAKAFIKTCIKSRKDYKGSGNPTMFTTEDMLTDCLLIEDGNGRVIYESIEKLKTALRVSDIVTVPVMENLTREGTGSDAGYDFALMGIYVNMGDYSFGADKGGAVNMFDDFDIDFNQMKYLIETRCSGALTKPHSAVVLELKTASSAG